MICSGLDASLALRHHFCSRSRSARVITPVARYFTLIPSPSEVHCVRGFPRSALQSPSSSRVIIPSSSTLSASVFQLSFSSSTNSHSPSPSLQILRTPFSVAGNSPLLFSFESSSQASILEVIGIDFRLLFLILSLVRRKF